MANELTIFDDKQLSTIKEMYCKNLTEEEITVFMHICARTKLDPFARQIYAVKRKDNKLGKEVMTIQTGIDGYRLVAERTGKYSPGREPIFQYDAKGAIVSSTAFIMKMTADGKWHEVAATAFWNEYCQKYDGKPSGFWAKMPHGQISKCAEALAIRKAFPADLSGFYTKEEMEQSESDLPPLDSQEIEVKEVETKKAKKELPKVEAIELTDEQKMELYALSELCDPEYMAKLHQYLDSLSIRGLHNVKSDKFSMVMKGMKSNAESYQQTRG